MGGKVLADLRALGELKEWHGAGTLAPILSEKGAARAVHEAGGPISQPICAGQWRSSAYQLYLDLSSEGSRAAASILVAASDDE